MGETLVSHVSDSRGAQPHFGEAHHPGTFWEGCQGGRFGARVWPGLSLVTLPAD